MAADNYDRLFRQAVEAGRNRDYVRAAALLTRIVTSTDRYPHALLYLGRSYHALRQHAKAVQILSFYLKTMPESEPGHFFIGRAYLALGQFKKAIELRPHWAEAHNALGFMYTQQGKDDLASKSLERALEIKPRLVDALVNLSALALRRKDFEKAIDYGTKALAADKANPGALNNVGKAFFHQGRLREALKVYKIALQSKDVVSPEVVYLNMGFCYYRMREWAQAAAAYERAASINPNFAYAYYCLAQVRYRQEQHKDAWRLVHKAQDMGYKVHERFLKMLRQAQAEPRRK